LHFIGKGEKYEEIAQRSFRFLQVSSKKSSSEEVKKVIPKKNKPESKSKAGKVDTFVYNRETDHHAKMSDTMMEGKISNMLKKVGDVVIVPERPCRSGRQ